jgi:hypothetical protein
MCRSYINSYYPQNIYRVNTCLYCSHDESDYIEMLLKKINNVCKQTAEKGCEEGKGWQFRAMSACVVSKRGSLTFLLTPYLYTFSLCENPSFIIFSAETEYISTRSWYRNINFLRDRIRRIINFPNMCSNIPASPVYGVYISQLIRDARASSNYSDFLKKMMRTERYLWSL